MDTSVSDAPVGRLLSGRYLVGARIARGGMATVYEAMDTRLERPVALKVMHPDLAEDTDFVARFTAEARAAARLAHPDVVAVFDQGEDDGWVWLAMEHVRGRTLRTVLAERGRLEPALALEVTEHVLAALTSAHDAGLVHRDVKPENVLVATDGRVKVADFGLARALDGSAATATRGVLLGTVAYLSPEQALGQPATRRSDVYSTGVMLFELLTGRTPHAGATDYLVVRNHIEHDVPPPSSEVPGLPAEVDVLVAAATAREPAQRYADAAAFRGAVRRARAVPDRGRAGLAREAVTGPVEVAALGGARHSTAVIDVLPPRIDAGIPDLPGSRPRGRRRLLLLVALTVLLLALGSAAYWYGWARWTSAPSVVGLTVEQATVQAEGLGFTVSLAEPAYSEDVAAGAVVATDPDAGDRVLDGATVVLVPSLGPERFEVPDLGGLTAEAAEDALSDAELVPGEVARAWDESVDEGRVVEQATAAGTPLRAGTAVAYTVSRGPRPIDVPDLVGQRGEAAESALAELGLRAEVARSYDDTVPAGVVSGQSPRGGTLTRDDTVRLTVSRGPRTVTLPDTEGGAADDAETRLEALGLDVRVVAVLPGGPGQILRMAPTAGTTVRVGSAVTLYTF